MKLLESVKLNLILTFVTFEGVYRQILIDLIRLKVKGDKFLLEMLTEDWVLILFRSSF